MPVLVDVLPRNQYEQIILAPGGKINGNFVDGMVNPTWLQNVFTDLANATVTPFAQKNYEALKAIDEYWKINAIHWRKAGVFEVYNMKATDIIEEEEAFLLEMYPPAPEETPQDGETTEEGTTEGA